SNPPPATSTNPCVTVANEADVQPLDIAPEEREARRALKTNILDGSSRWRVLDALWTHREYLERNSATPSDRRTLSSRRSADVGEIAVLQDEGDLILPPNSYDLRSLGLRFTRNGSGGYNVTRIEGNFRATLGTRLTLDDDDSAPGTVPFGFSFYGKSETAAFVNSDGNITPPSSPISIRPPARVGFFSMPRHLSSPPRGATSAASTRREPSRCKRRCYPTARSK
ncbi:MAG: hypothetical protein JF613_07920, partial [Acidobacteria bacterium]|nr:hypothetical protein [Acidobacteriota bacterium]